MILSHEGMVISFLFFSNKFTVVQGAEVTVSTSDGTTELQMASLVPQPARLDESGCVASCNWH